MRAVLLDIEGTTTPIAFVRDRLFPYARRELRPFLDGLDEESLRSIAADFRQEHVRDTAGSDDLPRWIDGPGGQRESIVRYVLWLMDRDRKSTALKALQGRIWANGYASGELVAPVYDDVPVALRRWRGRGVGTAIYSSGSVVAQQLLFRHASAGDLTPWLQWHFDTSAGAKTDPASYRRIASAIGVPAGEILFVSDAVRELDAAREAGQQTVLCCRLGEDVLEPSRDHPVISSLDEIP